jgi:hypothetical protein
MRALVVYESMFGNTKDVAMAVERGLSLNMEVRLAPVDSSVTVGADVDLVVVGGPTHAFSMSRPQTRAEAVVKGAPRDDDAGGIREWLTALPAARPGTQVATFDTRVEKVRHLPGSAARKAARVAGKHGYGVASPPESFYVLDTAGPLLDGELDRARAWGERLGRATGAGGQHGAMRQDPDSAGGL